MSWSSVGSSGSWRVLSAVLGVFRGLFAVLLELVSCSGRVFFLVVLSSVVSARWKLGTRSALRLVRSCGL
eukprot:783913-Rhodomonas_salina.1